MNKPIYCLQPKQKIAKKINNTTKSKSRLMMNMVLKGKKGKGEHLL